MPMILIAESGSTKTDWCLLHQGCPLIRKQTQGINPYIQSPDQILGLLNQELCWDFAQFPLSRIYFYGAGTGSPGKKALLESLIRVWAPKATGEVHGDMMAAARGLCGNSPGMVAILGTGSNAAFYDGRDLASRQISLGYLAGDEGSGNQMGKKVLQYMAYHRFEPELEDGFRSLFPEPLEEIIGRLYEAPFPNRFLAGFVPFLIAHRGHYMVENIIEDCLNEFFLTHILKFRESWSHPLHFTGSVAYAFRDRIQDLCQQYGLSLGTMVASPMEGLIQYHLHSPGH